MTSYDYDLFTVGAGSGGVRASRMSGATGARVAVAEDSDLGGTCVNLGCIPKKLLVYGSHYPEAFEEAAAGYGFTVGQHSFDWKTLISNKNKEIARLNGVYDSLLSNAGVDLIRGRAKLIDPHTVEVGERRYTAENILVAVGGWPSVPDLPGIEHTITSNEVFHLEELPTRVLIVGGGYIAVEFAGIFHGLGAEVTQIYRGPMFLRGFDDHVREHLAGELRKKRLDLRFDLNVAEVEKKDGELRVSLTDGSELRVDQVVFATGRRPKTSDLGLESAGVKMDANGAIIVDEFSRSSAPSVWAIGDVTDRVNLTPVALHEGMCLVKTLFQGTPTAPDHETIASAVFSQPPIGSVGLTESQARDRHGEIDVYLSRFRPLLHTMTAMEDQTLMKLIVDRASDRVVGLHMVGPDAAEIIQGFAVAIKAGATKAQFDATIGVHPTAAEELVTMREPLAQP